MEKVARQEEDRCGLRWRGFEKPNVSAGRFHAKPFKSGKAGRYVGRQETASYRLTLNGLEKKGSDRPAIMHCWTSSSGMSHLEEPISKCDE